MSLNVVTPIKESEEPPEKEHVGYTFEYLNGIVEEVRCTNIEVFPGLPLVVIFSDDEDEHIEMAFGLNNISRIEAIYE